MNRMNTLGSVLTPQVCRAAPPLSLTQVNDQTDSFASVARGVLEMLASDSLPNWHSVAPTIRLVRLRSGEHLFRVGQSQPFVFFVRQGVLKMVYETGDGKEWIKAFAGEGAFFSSLSGLQPGGQTTFSVLALQDAVVEKVDYAVLHVLAEQHMAWQRALRRAFEIYGFRKEKREKDLLTLTAEERYRNFVLDHPDLEPRISQKDLAGYIRVTPVGLSRIKTRIKRAGNSKAPG
jgi:CRP-like cAMP-binding protein